MARFIQSVRTTLSRLRSAKTLTLTLPPFVNPNPLLHTRNYIAEMRKSAFESNILRILRSEMAYQSEYAPPKQLDKEFNSFVIEDRPGEQWIRLRGRYGDKEEIKVEVTMFDGAVSASKSGEGDDVRLHISLIVDVSKGEGCGVMEFICSAWPDSLEIQKVFILNRGRLPAKPYVGPGFGELDDDLQSAMQEFLEVRGINDDLAIFLHEYMKNKDKFELIQWMRSVKSFVEK